MLSLLAIFACNTVTPVPNSDSADAKIYVASCGSCHSVPHPRRHTKQQWEHVLKLMDRRIKERKFPPIKESDREQIRTYLLKYAR